ncbi:MAG: hypothetical protein ACRC67_17535 [Inquilinus sp.]|uniref:hypothetical protein n=1 Tax=Inquilinus sp. TaxID=1932117 RepID=UPI003F3605C7
MRSGLDQAKTAWPANWRRLFKNPIPVIVQTGQTVHRERLGRDMEGDRVVCVGDAEVDAMAEESAADVGQELG